MNEVGGTNSLSKSEWLSTEALMPLEEKQTHLNLRAWMQDHAKMRGIKDRDEEQEEEDDAEILKMLEGGEDGDDDDDDEEPEAADSVALSSVAAKPGEDGKEDIKVEKDRNWSAVNLTFRDSKLTFRGSFSNISFTNWLWWRIIRPKLETTKSKEGLPEVDINDGNYGIADIEEILGEFAPPLTEKKEKDKKEKDKDKDKKKKEDKKEDKKKKKDQVTLNKTERAQAEHCVKGMILGAKGKKGFSDWIEEKDIDKIPVTTPWEFQLAHVVYKCMTLEYTSRKKKENPDPAVYYELVQAMADAISLLKRQYQLEFPNGSETDILPLQDVLAVQKRFRDGSVGTLKFDLLWYLQNGAHLIAGSSFMKRHRTTVFKPLGIQEKMVEAIYSPGPQCVFGIAPPGTGKTAIVCHLLSLFPGHSLVFCCAALPVVLGVGRIANTLGVPFAFVKGRKITPSYSCGRGLHHFTDGMIDLVGNFQNAVEAMRYKIILENLQRKKKKDWQQ